MWRNNNATIKTPIFMKFVLGGLSGATATTIIYPFYVINNLIRINNKNYLNYFKMAIIRKGPLVLYKGMRSQIIHHTLFTAIRIGVYSSLHNSYKLKYNEQPKFSWRIAMGSIASALSLFIGGPTDTISTICTEHKHEYRANKKYLINLVVRKIREEGIVSLWRLHYSKRTAYNMVQLASYSQSKHNLQDHFQMKDDINLYILASIISSIAKAFTYIPIKYIELHYEKIPCYTKYPSYFFHDHINWIDFRKYVRQFYWSMGYTIVTFILLEKFTNWYADHVLGDKSTGSGL